MSTSPVLRSRSATAEPAKGVPVRAADLPVAQVTVDVPHAHLDRVYDYLVPEHLSAQAVPGVRLRVRFAGRLVDAFLLERRCGTDHPGSLGWVERVVSAEPVLTPVLLRLCRAVADRGAGTLADVLRLAIPPRHARAERTPTAPVGPNAADERVRLGTEPDPDAWSDYPSGPAFLRALGGGGSPRAVWAAMPGPDWPSSIAAAVAACVSSGRGAIVVAPDGHDVARLDVAVAAALGDADGQPRHVVLSADLGPQERYRRWLAVRRGQVPVVLGSRSAAFAPVANLGLVVCWDDGDDLHDEPRAPYPNARDVLALYAHQSGAGALIGGFVPSVEALQLVETGWAKPVGPTRATLRERAPRVEVVGSDFDVARDAAATSARIPTAAWTAIRTGLAALAPVLVQVPRGGYLPGLSCASCRRPARCGSCAGPLARSGTDPSPACGWCGKVAAAWSCPQCAGSTIRAVVVGSARTAEELGRSFPGVTVRTSGRDGILTTIADAPAIVVATPGAEPVAPAGYGAVVLLDGWVALSRPDLRAAEETLRRWSAAAALARSGRDGGRVVVLADSALPVVQALVRWDPTGFVARESAERQALGLPPAIRLAVIEGDPEAVDGVLAALEPTPGMEILGPVPVSPTRRPGGPDGDSGSPETRALVRVPRAEGAALATALKAAQAMRSARKVRGVLRVRLDPREVG